MQTQDSRKYHYSTVLLILSINSTSINEFTSFKLIWTNYHLIESTENTMNNAVCVYGRYRKSLHLNCFSFRFVYKSVVNVSKRPNVLRCTLEKWTFPIKNIIITTTIKAREINRNSESNTMGKEKDSNNTEWMASS